MKIEPLDIGVMETAMIITHYSLESGKGLILEYKCGQCGQSYSRTIGPPDFDLQPLQCYECLRRRDEIVERLNEECGDDRLGD